MGLRAVTARQAPPAAIQPKPAARIIVAAPDPSRDGPAARVTSRPDRHADDDSVTVLLTCGGTGSPSTPQAASGQQTRQINGERVSIHESFQTGHPASRTWQVRFPPSKTIRELTEFSRRPKRQTSDVNVTMTRDCICSNVRSGRSAAVLFGQCYHDPVMWCASRNGSHQHARTSPVRPRSVRGGKARNPPLPQGFPRLADNNPLTMLSIAASCSIRLSGGVKDLFFVFCMSLGIRPSGSPFNHHHQRQHWPPECDRSGRADQLCASGFFFCGMIAGPGRETGPDRVTKTELRRRPDHQFFFGETAQVAWRQIDAAPRKSNAKSRSLNRHRASWPAGGQAKRLRRHVAVDRKGRAKPVPAAPQRRFIHPCPPCVRIRLGRGPNISDISHPCDGPQVPAGAGLQMGETGITHRPRRPLPESSNCLESTPTIRFRRRRTGRGSKQLENLVRHLIVARPARVPDALPVRR